MRKKLSLGLLLTLGLLTVGLLQSCESKEPSAIKIFVRDANTKLVEGCKVTIVADKQVNESGVEHVSDALTNSSGFALFSINSYYEESDPDEVAYFDVYCESSSGEGTERVRNREHTTTVETVYLDQ